METLINKLQREADGDLSTCGGGIPDKRTEVEIAAERYAANNYGNENTLRRGYLAGWKACEEKIQTEIDRSLSESFNEWSREEVNGYKTAMARISRYLYQQKQQ